MKIARVLLDRPPFDAAGRGWKPGGVWPARWVTARGVAAEGGPQVMWFSLQSPGGRARVHVSGDQRYELFVGGERVGGGPEAGDERRWRFDSYDVDLPAGTRVRARVWWLGHAAPLAWHGVRPAFLLAAEGGEGGEGWNTGSADWLAQATPVAAVVDSATFGAGGYLDRVPAGALWPDESAWTPATVVPRAVGQALEHAAGQAINAGDERNTASPRRLIPAMLPAMRREALAGRVVHCDGDPDAAVDPASNRPGRAAAWQALLDGGGPLESSGVERVLIDFGGHACAWPTVAATGHGTVAVRWGETLYDGDGRHWAGLPKGDRGATGGKRFFGVGDLFQAGDGREATPPTWRAGRYAQVEVRPESAAAAAASGVGEVRVDRLAFEATGYPHEFEGTFDVADGPGPLLARLDPICRRTLSACSHDTYMDTPFYERLQYVGDTRIQALLTYALTRDDRLPRQAILAFDDSRRTDGLTRSRWPSSEDQCIPPFSLWWVAMVHDHALWRDDAAFVKGRMNGVRAVLDAWLDGPPAGWMFCDWVPSWDAGVPPDGGAIFAAHLCGVLRLAAELEREYGRHAFADLYLHEAKRRAADLVGRHWNGTLFDVAGTRCEQAQILALLSPDVVDAMPPGAADGLWRTLRDGNFDAVASVYFSHYLFDLCHHRRDLTPMTRRLSLWRDMLDAGCRTTVEGPDPSRSDCHAWSAHPTLHAITTVLGVRPVGFGFERAIVAPLARGRCEVPHPSGTIRVEATGRGRVRVEAPAGVAIEVDDAALPA